MQVKAIRPAILITLTGLCLALATPTHVFARSPHSPKTEADQPPEFLSDLTTVLPELAKTSLPTQLELKYSWGGYAPTHSETQVSLTLSANQQQFQASGKHQILSYNNAPPKTTLINKPLPATLVSKILGVLGTATWKMTEHPLSFQDHTDDYPSYSISFNLNAKQKVRLFSTSNTSSGAPWNLQLGDKLYASSDQEIGKAVHGLFEAFK